MPEEGFLRRWARMKAAGEASGGEAVAEAPRPVVPAAPVAPVTVAEPVRQATPGGESAGEPPPSAPTLEDAARLTPASDFSAFVSQGVDKDVRRLALKKLFADPHFNVMDRLDMYMDDYNKPDPVSATMLAALEHARGALRRPEEVQAELARLAARDRPVDAAARALETELSGVPVVEGQLGTAQQAASAISVDEPAADARVPSEPPTDPAIDAAPASDRLPARPIEPAADTIALPSLGAHNAEARP